jgi:hypothetical protein
MLNSSTLTIANTAPTHTTPGIVSTSGNNVTTDNITCYNQSTYDADNDSVTNIYNWYRNGSSITALNMPFDTNTTSTASGAVKDYSGYNNNGTLGGGNISRVPAWNNSEDCVRGGCYSFDGIDDYVDLGSLDSLDFGTGDFTITVWINNKIFGTDPGTGSQYIIGRGWGDQSTHKGYALDFTWNSYWHDRLRFAIADGTNKSVCMKNVVGYFDSYKDQWLFIAAKRDGGTLYVYLNGTQWESCDASGVGNISVSGGLNDVVYIGDSPYSGTNYYWNGTMDEVKIYNYSLSADQIYQLYLEGNNSYTNSTITSSETSKGENWKCAVTPNDATDDGTTLNSTTLTIANTAPTHTR